ncbi:saccharopine dehydrogenase family protein [Sulfurimonas sp. SAG-AH-194-C21]|nr:saccharopine dehydrogenase family protein [Sulfurimonas sp. SAG-AH-194-C21]MDF1883538.1 saccharopine dehydrogenase family protein [Sulfurimonas sp. SAG-AH-194-C21]
MNKNKTTLIIGAGGVGRVVVHKCVQNAAVFGRIVLASRNIESCVNIKKELPDAEIFVTALDADITEDVITLIEKINADIVINVALPYQDLTIMDACIATCTPYLDTANYEHPDEAKFEYKLQWARDEKFKEAGIMGLLGSGFDPGVTNVFCAFAQKHYFDTIDTIDIYDCNDGNNGYIFATNFNPEINLREVSAKGRYWDAGRWYETEPLQMRKTWDYPEIGERDSYLMYHEEMESLTKNIKGLKQIKFYMTFTKAYLDHMHVLKNVGMLGIKEIEHKGQKIIPIELLKTLLPDPSTLGKRTKGKTNIGVVVTGIKNAKRKRIYIYQVSDHQKCYKEVNSQAISYTTGVPAMIGAKLMLEGEWSGSGVFNMEEFDPDPFMQELVEQGLPWKVKELEV